MALWQLSVDGNRRLGVGSVANGPEYLLSADVTLDGILSDGRGWLDDPPVEGPVPERFRVLAPVQSQEVWAAGVTYQRSRAARVEEAETPDHYDKVYVAERPELFFKANGARVRGPDMPIGIRFDSSWNVPEPELGLVVNHSGEILGYVVANDVSSRSIEGENPLYLPQAKSYTGSCALGPCIVPVAESLPFDEIAIEVLIERDSVVCHSDAAGVSLMARKPEDLVAWLMRAMDFPTGVVLLTGTPIVPPADFSLQPGDVVTVSMSGLGRLKNVVETVGSAQPTAV
jgi:2-dehydro-3-deoxy-D-arabinonate dehydratase